MYDQQFCTGGRYEENCTDHRFAGHARKPGIRQEAKTVGAAPAEAKFSTVSKDEMFSSKLKGLNVYNQKDESVGEITDIAIKGNQIDALILSVGGFLGMGEHYVAVSPSSVSVKRRHQERQMGGDDEHHQGSAEGRAGIQVSEVSSAFRHVRTAAAASRRLFVFSSLRERSDEAIHPAVPAEMDASLRSH